VEQFKYMSPHSHHSVFIVLLWFGNSSTHWPGFTPGVAYLFASIPHTKFMACFIVQGPIHQFQISFWIAR